ncbi:hypothetical protein BTUAT1_10710 [Bacillus altitudinis]|nr:hypothetical protein BTUAT1_10710 [Bacillus pumilus]
MEKQMQHQKKPQNSGFQRVDKPSHSLSVLRAGAHECEICSAPVLVFPRVAKVFYHVEKKTKG